MTIGYSRSGSNGAAGSGTILSAASVVISAGERIYVRTTANGTATETITDGTNTYVFVGTVTNTTSGDVQNVYECMTPVPGTYTVVQTLGTARLFRGLQWVTVAGSDQTQGTGFLGQFQAGPGTGTNAATSGSYTPSSQPALCVAWIYDFTTNGLSLTPASGYTSNDTFATETGINGDSSCFASQRITALTSTAAAFTIGATGAGDECITIALFIPETSVAGPGVDDDQVVSG